MKNLQWVIFAVILVGLVAGVTFLRNSVSSPQSSSGGPPIKPGGELKMDFPLKTALPTEYEYHGGSHEDSCDFWFKNANDQPVEIGLELQSCKCSRVEVTALTAQEEALLPLLVVSQAMGAPTGLLNWLGFASAFQENWNSVLNKPGRWQPIMFGKETRTAEIPARSAGLTRIYWKQQGEGAKRLAALVWAQGLNNPKTRTSSVKLDVPILLVRPLRVLIKEEELKLPVELDALNRNVTVETYCWSCSRTGFQLAAREERNDPCFSCTCTRLRGAAFEDAAAILRKEEPTDPLEIYRVQVTVHERLANGTQMDLGPFRRAIKLTSDLDLPDPNLVNLSFLVTGAVRGDITVGTSDDEKNPRFQDSIILKTFDADVGITATFPISSNMPGLKLELESVVPPFLQVQLTEKKDEFGPGRWELVLTVPPDKINGRLKNAAIYLKTNSQPPRRIRIPVVGSAVLR